jgi:hypothetical protein
MVTVYEYDHEGVVSMSSIHESRHGKVHMSVRQTGRTTRQVQEAAEKARTGERVWFVAATMGVAEYARERFLEHCDQEGVEYAGRLKFLFPGGGSLEFMTDDKCDQNYTLIYPRPTRIRDHWLGPPPWNGMQKEE